ncbi:hypothetical protein RJ55_01705 [Drechmeria coniospora]|nr:hypothetical protein RJ55_01705 [Drechmeria coniospora]
MTKRPTFQIDLTLPPPLSSSSSVSFPLGFTRQPPSLLKAERTHVSAGNDTHAVGHMLIAAHLRHGLRLMVPLAMACTVYLYLYPVFSGCAFPVESRDPREAFDELKKLHWPFAGHDDAAALPTKLAPFRLLALGDPQLEGDTSIPTAYLGVMPHVWSLARHLTFQTELISLRDRVRMVLHDGIDIFLEDVPNLLESIRKRFDLLGNDFYLAHIYRTLHWWTRPTHVSILGDLLGSQWIEDDEFDRRGERYWNRTFRGGERLPDEVALYPTREYNISGRLDGSLHEQVWARRILNVAGNHDIGYAGDLTPERLDRFERVFGKANYELRFDLPLSDAEGKGKAEAEGGSDVDPSASDDAGMDGAEKVTAGTDDAIHNNAVYDEPVNDDAINNDAEQGNAVNNNAENSNADKDEAVHGDVVVENTDNVNAEGDNAVHGDVVVDTTENVNAESDNAVTDNAEKDQADNGDVVVDDIEKINAEDDNAVNDNSIVNDNAVIDNAASTNAINENAADDNTVNENAVNDNAINDNAINDNTVNENAVNENAVGDNMVNENGVNENSVNENAVNENAINDYTVNENAVNDNAVNDNAINDNTVNENAVNDNAVNDNTVNENSVNENAVNENTVNENTVNENAINDNAINDNTVNENAINDNTVNENAVNENGVNDNTANENAINDNTVNENAVNDNGVNDNVVNENAVNDNVVNEHAVNHNTVNENGVYENGVYENAVNDNAINDYAVNENAVNDNAVNDNAVNDNAVNDNAVNENAANDYAVNNVVHENAEETDDTRLPPQIRVVVLNDMNLDTPAKSQKLQDATYKFINAIISTSAQVGKKGLFTLVLTHIPLYKREGVCVDAPFFDFHTHEDGGGVKEQYLLSSDASKGFLEGIYGVSGDPTAPGLGLGRSGLVINGHDHEGCDTYHFINQTNGTTASERSWEAVRWRDAQTSNLLGQHMIPGRREITVRSMMGDYGGNAGLLSMWFNQTTWEWEYEYVDCPLGRQHFWWLTHFLVLGVFLLAILYAAITALEAKGFDVDASVFRAVRWLRNGLEELSRRRIEVRIRVVERQSKGGSRPKKGSSPKKGDSTEKGSSTKEGSSSKRGKPSKGARSTKEGSLPKEESSSKEGSSFKGGNLPKGRVVQIKSEGGAT